MRTREHKRILEKPIPRIFRLVACRRPRPASANPYHSVDRATRSGRATHVQLCPEADSSPAQHSQSRIAHFLYWKEAPKLSSKNSDGTLVYKFAS